MCLLAYALSVCMQKASVARHSTPSHMNPLTFTLSHFHLYSPLKNTTQVRGLCRSDDLSRMLPSEMAMMAHGWPRKAHMEGETRCAEVFIYLHTYSLCTLHTAVLPSVRSFHVTDLNCFSVSCLSLRDGPASNHLCPVLFSHHSPQLSSKFAFVRDGPASSSDGSVNLATPQEEVGEVS